MAANDVEDRLGRLRAICLALPETTENLSHGQPAFSVAGKMFCYFWADVHGDGLTRACVKTAGRDQQEMLLDADPEVFSKLPYLHAAGWIGMDIALAETDWAHVAARVAASWRLAAPRRLAED